MTNTLMAWLIPAQIAALVAVFVLRTRLSGNVRIAVAAAFAIVGLSAVLLTELTYSSANTRALDAPLNLSRAGTILAAPFTTPLGGRYELFFETDHSPGIAKFGCLTGDDRFEALCPTGAPELDAAWTVSLRSIPVAHGGSDVAGWHARQAALDPATAARRRAGYAAGIAKIENPSDGTPLFHSLGGFAARAGQAYALTLQLRRPAPTLAAFHPRLLIGYSDPSTQGLGMLVVIFCLLGVAGGAAIILPLRGSQRS
jgi:hypothetical protein